MPSHEGIVTIDANLLVLLVVGSASPVYIEKHERLSGYTVDDFDLLVAEFDEIVLLPHILAETSNLVRQVERSARASIIAAFRILIETCAELPLCSRDGARRAEFDALGLTDAMALHLCATAPSERGPTLITVDEDLADAAHALGYGVVDDRREFMTR